MGAMRPAQSVFPLTKLLDYREEYKELFVPKLIDRQTFAEHESLGKCLGCHREVVNAIAVKLKSLVSTTYDFASHKSNIKQCIKRNDDDDAAELLYEHAD